LKDRKYISVILVFFILTTTFFGILLIHFNSYPVLNIKGDDEWSTHDHPKLANGPPLAYWAINRNTTTVHRLFESINISINTFGFAVDYALIKINFTNSSINNYDMIPGGINEYYFEYKPLYNDPLGFQNVSFLLYNSTDHLQNNHTTYTNFTTITNYMLTTNSSEYYIGDDLYAELTVNDFGSYQFGWNITIVDNTIESLQQSIFNLENDLVQFTYRITNETFRNYVGQTFYIKLNMTNNTGGYKAAAYFPFKVLNSDPIIDISSISFTPSDVFRTEECEITLNVTDIEDASKDLDVSMSLEDPEGDFFGTITIDHNIDNNFTKLFTIAAGRPIGKFRITINAEDQNGGISSYLIFLTVKNNLPEIHSYEINGKSMSEALSIFYGNDLTFHFNVSDVENVAYVKVALVDENDDWYNISKAYTGIDTQITIRTIDLITGVWYVYIYVTDSDGATTSLISDYNLAPQSIRIIPDTLSGFLPWTLFIIGTIIGVLVGVGLAYRHYKSKFGETQVTPRKEKSSIKKQQKEEKYTEKISEKEVEEIKPEKEPEKEISAKRKIKRKL
jgi:hypothetical protein